nr:reverse transcriptase domain-containing protein [Tanacetum cinerariifolium]GEW28527.1 reverse transcriptase domain-containing protein [Tanacetum cinerariifolium]
MFKQLHINITLADALIFIPKYQKMLKALLSNKEKLLELENTLLNENCSAVILKKSLEKLGDPGKFLIPKKLGLPELISTRMTLELANRAICTPDGIARDVFVSVGKFTFPADFFIVDYENDPRVPPPILGRPFLWTARALIDVHGEEMILHDEGGNVLIEKLLYLDSIEDLPPPHNVNPLSGSITSSSSPNYLLEGFADELALITFPLRNDDLPFDIESDLKEIEYLLNNDPIKEMDSILNDSIDQSNLVDLNDNLADTMPEMFTDEHALDYSSPSLYDKYDDDLIKVESSDFLPSPKYDSFLFEDFFEVDALPLTNNEDKNVKKIAISYASLILVGFDPPLYELPFLKEVPGSKNLLSFSSENEENVFKPGILTSKGVHFSLLLELSHQGYKIFKIIKILKSPMEICLCFYEENIRILDVPCLHFYPPRPVQVSGVGSS